MAQNANFNFAIIDGVDCSPGLVSVVYERKRIGNTQAANDGSKDMAVNPDKGRGFTITWRWYGAQRDYLRRLANDYLNETQEPFQVTTGNTHSGFRAANSSCVITECDDMPSTAADGTAQDWSARFESGISTSDYSGLQTAGKHEFTQP